MYLTPSPSDVIMDSPSPIEIISRHGGLEEAREKFISAFVAENGNGKLAIAKTAYPGLAKQVIATETGESQILDEVGFVDDDRKIGKVIRVTQSSQIEQISSVATSSKHKALTSGAKACVDESRVPAIHEDQIELGLDRGDDDPGRSVNPGRSAVSPSRSPVPDNSGRHECALSDFSIDKEDYRLTRYGLDDSIELQEQNENSVLQCSSLDDPTDPTYTVPNVESVEPTEPERKESDTIEEDFSDNMRRPNTQVLVLVSAMIHNTFDQESATLILEEKGVQSKGEITIYKGDPDGSVDKLSLLVQSPVLSSVSDESTIKIQEIVDEESACAKGSDLLAVDTVSKRDMNIEIDGKYVKSVVNSRKSPRKSKNGQMRVYENDEKQTKHKKTEKRISDSCTQSEETFYKTVSKSSSKVSSSKSKSPRREGRSRSSAQKVSSSSRIHDSESVRAIGDGGLKNMQRCNTNLKGSLDSVIATSDSTAPRRSKAEEVFTKKSKSYESIKKIQEACYEDPSKADSTSQLITTNELDMQTDEYCSVCCYVNEMSLRTEEGIDSPENFYTLHSNCSSIVDEDSTECDICSSWNLQESDCLDRKIVSSDYAQLCEVCEICGEICATFNSDMDTAVSATWNTKDSHGRVPESKSLPKSSRIVDSAATDPTLDEDSFEIENCGLQSGPESMDDRPISDLPIERPSTKPLSLFDVPVTKKRDTYFVPKDEVAILTSGVRRMGRKGSLLRKKPEDSAKVSQDNRRYSSVDNLQLAKVSSRSNDKILKKNSKLIASADNIRASKGSRRCKSLQRSADNVRYVDSSTDNLDSLVEGLDIGETQRSVGLVDRPKIRDNETVKMILTKHGIKIISEKETAL